MKCHINRFAVTAGLFSLLTFTLLAITGAPGVAEATDCAALGGVGVAPADCVVSVVSNVAPGTYNLSRTLRITSTGRIDASNDRAGDLGITINVCVPPAPAGTCDVIMEGGGIDASDDANAASDPTGVPFPNPNEPADSPKSITLNISRDLLMASGSFITAENRTGGGGGTVDPNDHKGDIRIVVGRNISLNNDAGDEPGAIISTSRLAGSAGGFVAGDIFMKAGPDPQDPVGRVLIQEHSQVKANNVANKGGRIDIIAGNSITVHGDVLSEALPGTNNGEGGPIFLITCTLLIGDEGVVSSKGNDPGADLVHVEGCIVTINGLVQSTGPGHQDGAGKLCQDEDRGPAHVQTNRPGFSNWTACVEVWSGTTITISATAEVHADVGMSGGTTGGSWIDLFARGNITIAGDGNLPFSVHANMIPLTNSHGGLVTIKTLHGTLVATGLAVQTDATGAGSDGGEQILEAFGLINLNTATLSAQGDSVQQGGFGTGGHIAIRSFIGNLSWLNGVGNVLPTGDAVPVANQGLIEFLNCLTGTVNTTGTNFPFLGVLPTSPVTVALGVACGGAPTVAAYVILPLQNCAARCQPPSDEPPGDCPKSSVESVLNKDSGRFPGNLGPDKIIRVHAPTNDIIQPFVDTAQDTNGDGYIILLVVAKDDPVDPTKFAAGGSTSQHVVISQAYPLPFALCGCSVTLKAVVKSNPTGSITASADAPLPPGGQGNIFVMDLHGADSNAAGWRVRGDGRYLRNVNALDNTLGIGIDIEGNGNIVHNGTSQDNGGVGIKVTGADNLISTAKAYANGSHGIQVAGNGNTVEKTDVGDKNKGNTGDGIHVEGDLNSLLENDVFANLGHGIFANGLSNLLKKNNAGDKGKGNVLDGLRVLGVGSQVIENDAFANLGNGLHVIGVSSLLKTNRAGDTGKGNGADGLRIDGGLNVLDGNRSNANFGDGIQFFSVTGLNNALKNNRSNEGAANGNKANLGCQYRFAEGTTKDQGGNKRNNANFPGIAGLYSIIGCH